MLLSVTLAHVELLVCGRRNFRRRRLKEKPPSSTVLALAPPL